MSMESLKRSFRKNFVKKNVVDPDEIIKDYGADTARLFMILIRLQINLELTYFLLRPLVIVKKIS